MAAATVDFERNTYLLHRHTPSGTDVDRYHMTVSDARAFKRQARATLGEVIYSKIRPTGGPPYGRSIARAMQSFYASRPDSLDARLSPELGRDVVRTCVEIGRLATGPPTPAGRAGSGPEARGQRRVAGAGRRCKRRPSRGPGSGASGFIGQELARQLLDRGHSIRLLVRNPGRLPPDLQSPPVDVVVGDLSRDSDLAKAARGHPLRLSPGTAQRQDVGRMGRARSRSNPAASVRPAWRRKSIA